MKLFLMAVAFALTANFSGADTVALVAVRQPIYLHESDLDPEIQFHDIPVAIRAGFPESLFQAIHLPYIPASDREGEKSSDSNVTSVYGIKVSVKETQSEPVLEYAITVDASRAKKPEGYPFSIDQAIEATVTCVRAMTPVRPETEVKFRIEVKRPAK